MVPTSTPFRLAEPVSYASNLLPWSEPPRCPPLRLGRDCLRRAGAAHVAQGAWRGSHHERTPAVIFVWLPGGPPHQDTFDMKPDAPAEYRGAYKPIRTNVPGIDICEHLPRLATCADKYALIRSIAHKVRGPRRRAQALPHRPRAEGADRLRQRLPDDWLDGRGGAEGEEGRGAELREHRGRRAAEHRHVQLRLRVPRPAIASAGPWWATRPKPRSR